MSEESFKKYNEEKFDPNAVDKYRSNYLMQIYGSYTAAGISGISLISAVYFHVSKKSKLKLINSLAVLPRLDKPGIVIVKAF